MVTSTLHGQNRNTYTNSYHATGICALPEDCIEAVIWGSSYESCPDWFKDLWDDYIFEDEFKYHKFVNDVGVLKWFDGMETWEYTEDTMDPYFYNEIELTEEWDIFIRNSKGDIMMTDMDSVACLGLFVGKHYFALNQDIFYYTRFIYGDQCPVVPHWLEKHIDINLLCQDPATYMMTFFDERGEIIVDPECYFLLTPKGDVRYLPRDKFLGSFIH